MRWHFRRFTLFDSILFVAVAFAVLVGTFGLVALVERARALGAVLLFLAFFAAVGALGAVTHAAARAVSGLHLIVAASWLLWLLQDMLFGIVHGAATHRNPHYVLSLRDELAPLEIETIYGHIVEDRAPPPVALVSSLALGALVVCFPFLARTRAPVLALYVIVAVAKVAGTPVVLVRSPAYLVARLCLFVVLAYALAHVDKHRGVAEGVRFFTQIYYVLTPAPAWLWLCVASVQLLLLAATQKRPVRAQTPEPPPPPPVKPASVTPPAKPVMRPPPERRTSPGPPPPRPVPAPVTRVSTPPPPAVRPLPVHVYSDVCACQVCKEHRRSERERLRGNAGK